MSEAQTTPTHEGSYAQIAIVYVALMVLLGMTIAFSFIVPGTTAELVIALGISTAKTGLIMWYFMHLKYRVHLVWLFASAGFVWLLVMFGLTLSDYLTRWWVLIEGY